MTDMKISTLLISFFIAAFMLTGMITFYSDLFGNYGTEGTESISIQNNATNIVGDVQQIGERYKDPEGFLENVGMVIEGGWSAITTVLSFPELLSNAFGTIAAGSIYKVPNWVGLLINAVVWSIIVFAVARIIFKVEI